jgi:hypothetical protein
VRHLAIAMLRGRRFSPVLLFCDRLIVVTAGIVVEFANGSVELAHNGAGEATSFRVAGVSRSYRPAGTKSTLVRDGDFLILVPLGNI